MGDEHINKDWIDDAAKAAQETALVVAKDQVKDIQKKAPAPPMAVSDLEALLIQGDLEHMTAEGRLAYYRARCDSLGLDYLSRPFDYIRVPIPGVKGQFKLILYANKNCGEQLRRSRHISSRVLKSESSGGIYRVYVRASEPIIMAKADGTPSIIGERDFDDVGEVTIAGLGGDYLANAEMKAHTKAHRRATLGLCGVGMADETETETIKGAITIKAEDIHKLSDKMHAEVKIGPLSSQLNNP